MGLKGPNGRGKVVDRPFQALYHSPLMLQALPKGGGKVKMGVKPDLDCQEA